MSPMQNTIAALTLLLTQHTAIADGPSGTFVVKAVWIENGIFYAITTDKPVSNPDGCTKTDMIFALKTNTAYKEIIAHIMLAKSTNTPMHAWTQGCFPFGEGIPGLLFMQLA